MVSLPLPQNEADRFWVDHAPSGTVPVAWWRRHKQPRRVIVYTLHDKAAPDSLGVTESAGPPAEPSTAWRVERRTTFEQLDFEPPPFDDIDSLRGIPPEHCTTIESEIALTWGGVELRMQIGATGPGGEGRYHWQSVQIDPLWENAAAQAVRIGGIIYNSDTYLWADLYLVLFANGVADVAAHFVNTKLHIEGYDFHGLPMIRFYGPAVAPIEARLPVDGHYLTMGGLQLNTTDASILMSKDHPGLILPDDDGVMWLPFSGTSHWQLPDLGPDEWKPGFARTVRFQLSLSQAAARIARYRVPSWWYAQCGETGPGRLLPVHGRFARGSEKIVDVMREHKMVRGRFDGGSGNFMNDGDAGIGLMRNYYHTGRPELLTDAINYCYYWADLAVDHNDFTVHQSLGGWPWKTCAYSKFRDVLTGYLETGDPYLLDTTEMCAESYWQWFRSNWPRGSIGRDSFSIGAWAMMWQYFDSEHARDRCDEFVRMITTVVRSRGNVGGQMGGGPHPGYHPSLYMTGVAISNLLDIAVAQVQKSVKPAHTLEPVRQLCDHFIRDDVELYPSALGRGGRRTLPYGDWGVLACRIYPLLARLQGHDDARTQAGMRECYDMYGKRFTNNHIDGRPGQAMYLPIEHDALMLGAYWTEQGVRIEPIGPIDQWPTEQTVDTPAGPLKIMIERLDESLMFRFESPALFDVEVGYGDWAGQTTSTGSLHLAPTGPAPLLYEMLPLGGVA